MTASQLEEMTGIPSATVALSLKRLRAASMIDSLRSYEYRKKWGRPKSVQKYAPKKAGRRPRQHAEAISWGHWYHDEQFYDVLEPLLKNKIVNIKMTFIDIVRNIVTDFKENEELNKFLPREEIHDECGWSHEAQEFLIGICLGILDEILDSEEYLNLGKELSYYEE